MTPTAFHPALLHLLRLQSHGRRRRIVRKLRQPRRLILSAVACVLAVVWLGNAALTVWLREAAAAETLRALLSLGLLLYATWHFAKAAFFRPESPFDWTPDERDLLAAMPLLPRDLVAYQVASVTVTTVLKAGLFTILLLPDLRSLALGFLVLLLAMLTLEMLRMAVDISAWGMGRLAYLAYRAVVIAALVVGGLAAGAVVVRENAFARIDLGEGLFDRWLEILIQLNTSVFGYAALPFRPLVDLILADRITAANLQLAAATAVVAGLAVAVIGLYAATARRVAQRERRNYDPTSRLDCQRNETTEGELERSSRQAQISLPRWGGAGALAWRQLVGARRQWGSLLTAMIAPAVLASAPCFVIADPAMALLFTAGTLAFYTFLLLPTAVRFDFRRDLDRLAILKGLPITPVAAVIGQTLVPVLIASLFQGGVLALAIVARSLPPSYLVVAMLIMLPLNVLVFALDNLIYLLYPYRMQQEGLEIFLRTMLTFTGKGLLFAVGSGAVAVWGFAAAAMTRGLSAGTGFNINPLAVFTAGMVAGPALLAAIVLYALSQTYRGMDPVEDIPT
jgi:Putative ABC exporter